MWHLDVLDIMITVAPSRVDLFLALLGIAWVAYYINEWKHRRD